MVGANGGNKARPLSNLVSEQWEFVKDIVKLIQKAQELGIVLTMGEGFRTNEQQAWYVQNGKSTVSVSQHQKRLAHDFNFFIDGEICWDKEKIRPLGDYWESLNTRNRWGGNWTSFIDMPHFERAS